MYKKQIWGVLFIGSILGALISCSKVIRPDKSAEKVKSVADSTTDKSTGIHSKADYRLIWSDEFNMDGNFDTSKWSFCAKGPVAWTKYLTEDSAYAHVLGGALQLKMDDAVIPGDASPFHGGGIKSAAKFNFTHGKIEVRAKFNQGQGSWPAIWMMPDDPAAYGGWPNSGELDIMEHVNYENVIHQTLHNAAVTNADGGSTATHSAAYNIGDYNVYTAIWTPASVQFYVNNTLQYTYNKTVNQGSDQWPYDRPFYILLNQSGGAGWPGGITVADLPFTMLVDYVRVYN